MSFRLTPAIAYVIMTGLAMALAFLLTVQAYHALRYGW